MTPTSPDAVDNLVRENTQSNMATASVLPNSSNAEASTTLTPAMLIQIFREWIHKLQSAPVLNWG